MALWLLVISAIFLCFAESAHAQVFKCHDAAGQITFSSFPCGERIEEVAVSVGSGNSAPAAAELPVETPSGHSLTKTQSASTTYTPETTEATALDPHALSPEQIELLQMHQQLQRQSDVRMWEIANYQQQMELGTTTENPTTSGDRQAIQSERNNNACESAERALDSARERGRRGYSASESRSYKNRLRQAKDRARDACRRL